MPNWKKIIVSGSDATLNSLDVSSGITGSTLQLGNLGAENEILIVGANTQVTSSNLLAIDTVNQRVGIGTSTPQVKLDLVGESSGEAQVRVAQHDNTSDGPDIRFFKSHNTAASPTAVANNDYIGAVNAFAYDGSTYIQSGFFGFQADGTDGDSKFGLRTRVGGTLTDRITVDSAGDVVTGGSLDVSNNITGSALQLTSLPSQASEATSLMIGASGNVGTRELGSNAFNSTAFTTCTGTVTGVTSGNTNTITIGGTSTAPTVAVCIGTITGDNENLATGDQIYTFVTGQGYTTCVGDITGVTAGNGLTGGATSGNATLNIGAGTGIDVAADSISVDVSDFMSNGVNNRIITATGADAMNAEANLTFDGNVLTVSSKATIGTAHSNTGTNSTIAGGSTNTTSGTLSFIGGGQFNTGSGAYGFIGGGQNNSISDYCYSTIVGGCNNTISGYGNSSAMVGGLSNTLSDAYCGFIGGGFNNSLINSQTGQVIVGGRDNEVGGSCSGILGGTSNTVSNTNSFIIGSNLTSTANCYTFMNNACIAGTTRTQTLVETSARRYKECILPLQDQIENIKKLEPVEFQWKKEKTKDIGFIAEQVKEIYPDLVAYEEDGEISGVQYSKLTTVLVKALQQQQEQIEELKKEIFIIKNNLNG